MRKNNNYWVLYVSYIALLAYLLYQNLAAGGFVQSFDYSSEALQNRVSRLEKTIYGKASSGDIKKRIIRLANDISAEQIGLEIPPSVDTFSEEDTLTADSTVNYPIVDEIEMKLFNKTYKERDFHTRIVAIERKLFGKIYDVEDYSTRMDRIK